MNNTDKVPNNAMDIENTLFELLAQYHKLKPMTETPGIYVQDETNRKFVLTPYGFMNTCQYNNAEVLKRLSIVERAAKRYGLVPNWEMMTCEPLDKKSVMRKQAIYILDNPNLLNSQKVERLKEYFTQTIKKEKINGKRKESKAATPKV